MEHDFFLFRPQNEITSTIVIRSAQAPATYPIRHPISSYAKGRRGVFFTSWPGAIVQHRGHFNNT